MPTYVIGALRVSSNVPFDDLAVAADSAPVDVRLTMAEPRAEVEPEPRVVWSQRFHSSDGATVVAACGYLDGQPIIRRHGVADYLVSTSAALTTVIAVPEPAVTAATIAEEFLGTTLPLVLALRGEIGVHAGAVEIEGGIVAITGPSGAGKSTLVGFLRSHGYPALTDDYVALDLDAGDVRARPGHPRVRLWPDSRAALTRLSASSGRGVLPASGRPLVVRRVYVLAGAQARRHATTSIEAFDGSAATVAVFSQMHRFDLSDAALIARQMDVCARLVQARAVRRLSVASFDALPDALDRIRRDLTIA